MRRCIDYRSSKGSYTVETAIILPLLILAMLTLGYFIRVQLIWENCMHGAYDETEICAAKACDKATNLMVTSKVKARIEEDNKQLDSLEVSRQYFDDVVTDEGVTTYRIKAATSLELPAGFGREFQLDTLVRYRGFIGKKDYDGGVGRAALETGSIRNPVIIFPQEGEKYHGEECTYVKATVVKKVLTGQLKREYSACGLCKSGSVESGSIVYCFRSEGSAYHRSNCKSIDRYTITVDRDEAKDKGYTACSKCGGK
ncbi:MAG: pilus assembly protein [Eubacterium sp.]|nr:pilus assembly protein [Candidatus Colimonas fimequi]